MMSRAREYFRARANPSGSVSTGVPIFDTGLEMALLLLIANLHPDLDQCDSAVYQELLNLRAGTRPSVLLWEQKPITYSTPAWLLRSKDHFASRRKNAEYRWNTCVFGGRRAGKATTLNTRFRRSVIAGSFRPTGAVTSFEQNDDASRS
jgi:hypothetical protein